MTTHSTYLSPGFFVTLYDKRHSIHFTQFPGRLRRATPARLAVIDAFNRGYHGPLEDLIADVAQRYNGHRPALRSFIESLAEAGYLTDSAPPIRFAGAPSKTSAPVGPEVVTIATPVSLVSQAGQYLWYNHEGNLLVCLSLPEVIATATFCEPITIKSARELYLAQENVDGLNEVQFDELVSRLAGAGVFITPRAVSNLWRPRWKTPLTWLKCRPWSTQG